MDRLAGKVAIITGAARGQGAAEARAFVAEGAQVLVTDVLDSGEAFAEEIGAAWFRLDVTDPEAWKQAVSAAVETFGKLDVLVNNAGVLIPRPIEFMSLKDYMTSVQVNQVGCFLGMRAAIPAMKEAGGGSIVNTSSTSGIEGGYALVAYSATKHAVIGMTRSVALEVGVHDIRVNAICPGGVDTDMVRLPEFEGLDQPAWFARRTPLGRIGRPEEIAAAVVFLASDEASYITGAVLPVDGGMTTGMTAPGLERT